MSKVLIIAFMYDSLFRHTIAFVVTVMLAMIFWGGYVAGEQGWWILWAVFIPIYIFIYSLFGEGH